jgi:hypothetical protein
VVEYLWVFRHVGFFSFLAIKGVLEPSLSIKPSKEVTDGSALADYSDRTDRAHRGRLGNLGLSKEEQICNAAMQRQQGCHERQERTCRSTIWPDRTEILV